jgi:hypothetical protein
MLASRPLALVPLLIGATLVLAGCGPQRDAATDPSPAVSPSGTPTASSLPTDVPTIEPDSEEPLTIGCTDLVSLDDVYAFNNNFALLDDWTPDPGSLAAQAVAAKGIACRWQNLSSGEPIDIGAAKLSESAINSLSGDLASTAVTDYGVTGFFSPGTAQAISDRYWLSLVSPAFVEPGDAAQLVDAALSGLTN